MYSFWMVLDVGLKQRQTMICCGRCHPRLSSSKQWLISRRWVPDDQQLSTCGMFWNILKHVFNFQPIWQFGMIFQCSVLTCSNLVAVLSSKQETGWLNMWLIFFKGFITTNQILFHDTNFSIPKNRGNPCWKEAIEPVTDFAGNGCWSVGSAADDDKFYWDTLPATYWPQSNVVRFGHKFLSRTVPQHFALFCCYLHVVFGNCWFCLVNSYIFPMKGTRFWPTFGYADI